MQSALCQHINQFTVKMTNLKAFCYMYNPKKCKASQQFSVRFVEFKTLQVSVTSVGFCVLKFLVIHDPDVLFGVPNIPQQTLQPSLDLLLVLQGAADHHGLKLLVDGDGRRLRHAGRVQGQQLLPTPLHVAQEPFHDVVDDGVDLEQRLLLLGVSDGADGDLHRQRSAHQAVCSQSQLFPLAWNGQGRGKIFIQCVIWNRSDEKLLMLQTHCATTMLSHFINSSSLKRLTPSHTHLFFCLVYYEVG